MTTIFEKLKKSSPKKHENNNRVFFKPVIDYKNFSARRRFFACLILFCILFMAVFGKLFYVMIFQGAELQMKALDQWYRDVPTEAPRGLIVDTNGVVLASNSTKYTIFVRPNAIRNKQAVATALSATLGFDRSSCLEMISKKVSEITIAKSVSKDQMSMLYATGVKGIYYAENNNRYYPYGNFMSSLLGFTSSDGNGQTGLEAYYNKFLRGNNGKILTEADLVGKEIDKGKRYYMPAVTGSTLKTTINADIARIVQAAVNKAMLLYKPKHCACVVMNYKTGDIVAIEESPSFDLNNVPRDNLEKLFSMSKSTIVSNVFEPGSTFKILTSAIALQEGKVSVEQEFHCPGYRMIGKERIKCWKTKGHGTVTFAEGVEKSCNCVFMDCAMAVGAPKFYDYLKKLGLNEKTGIDMAGETSGILIKEESVKPVDLARIGFGQAIAVSPIELMCATSTVVNGGTKVTPHILNSIVDSVSNEKIYSHTESKGDRVFSAQTSATMNKLLTAVVENGSGKHAYVPGFKILGKTGTAQKYKNGAIASGKYVSSFLGFSLEKNAEYGVMFIVDEPQGYLYYGSLVAAPMVGDIFRNIFQRLNMKPHYSEKDYEVIGDEFVLPNFVGMKLNQAKYEIQKLGLHLEVDGDVETVKFQYPLPGTKVDKRNTVLLYNRRY